MQKKLKEKLPITNLMARLLLKRMQDFIGITNFQVLLKQKRLKERQRMKQLELS
jgi:hypothetical protein